MTVSALFGAVSRQLPGQDRESSKKPLLKGFVVVAVSLGIGFYLLNTFEFTDVLNIVRSMPTLSVSVAVAALAMALGVSCLRYSAVLTTVGLRVPLKAAAWANVLGIVGGLLFFQLLGQTLTRAAILRRYGVSTSAVLLANVYERGVALLLLLILAAGAAVVLFGGITLDMLGGGSKLAKLLVLLALVVTIGSVLGYRRPLAPGLKSIKLKAVASGFAKVSIPTLAIHLSMLGAYISLGHAVAPSASLVELGAASVIVMFAANIPVSFAGWGIREISAVYAYGAIGIGAEQALAVSVTIGVVSLLLLIVMAVFAASLPAFPNEAGCQVKRSTTIVQSISIDRIFGWMIPLLAGMLLFFQVRLPVNNGQLSVNLADPIVIAGGLIFLGRYIQLRDRSDLWRIDKFETLILFATFIVSSAFVIGLVRFGVTDWALYNRFFGWFILLCYLGAGALIIASAGKPGLIVLCRTMVLTGLILGAFDYLLLVVIGQGYPLKEWLPDLQISGMAQNRNAFAFQLLVLLSLTLTILNRSWGLSKPDWRSFGTVAMIVLLTALVYTKSRTGYIVGSSILLAAVALGWVRLSRVMIIIAWVATIVILPSLISMLGSILDLNLLAGRAFSLDAHANSSIPERWYSISRGFEMWTQHPFFGAGLGAFVQTVQEEKGIYLTIHNTSIWLLAECGLIGFAAFALIFFAAISSAWQQAGGEGTGQAMILLLLTFALFQLPHDILYQRIFWFSLGALLFSAKLPRSTSRSLSVAR